MNCIYFFPLLLFPICVFSFPDGTISEPFDLPYMVTVIFPDQSGMNGCLISDKHVLMNTIQRSLLGLRVQIKTTTYKPSVAGFWFKIVKVNTHPGFKDHGRYCVMILTLEENVVKTYKTKPVPLPTIPINRDWEFTFASYGNPNNDGELALINKKLTADKDCVEANYNKEIHVCVELNPTMSDVGCIMIYERILYGWNFIIGDGRKTAAFYLAADSLEWIDSILNPTNKTTTKKTTTQTTESSEPTKSSDSTKTSESTTSESTKTTEITESTESSDSTGTTEKTTVTTDEPKTTEDDGGDDDDGNDDRFGGARQQTVSTWFILISTITFMFMI